jgi:hypothetical protein
MRSYIAITQYLKIVIAKEQQFLKQEEIDIIKKPERKKVDIG